MVLHVLLCRRAHNYLGDTYILRTPTGPNTRKRFQRKTAIHCRVEDEDEQFRCPKYAFQNCPSGRTVDGY